MERINRILSHPLYREALDKTQNAERKRRYCHHDMAHFLDVARISWILALEGGIRIERETVYAAALLHDIGRYRQYEDATPHEQASAEIARRILPECGFDDKETSVIIMAVLGHRSAAELADDDGNAAVGDAAHDAAGGGGDNAVTGRSSGSGNGAACALRDILARADKLSRPCYVCEARESCHWSDEKKNLEIRI